MVGSHLFQSLTKRGLWAIGTYRTYQESSLIQLDICDSDQLNRLINDLNPAVVYLPAARPNVDWCEQNPRDSYQANVVGVYNVLGAVESIRARLVYFSSDYVFDGESGPYQEEDPANPICEYGRQKLLAEHAIALHCEKYLIVRTTGVFGVERQRKNFIYRLLETLQAGKPLIVPQDQLGTPTYAPHLVNTIIHLAEAEQTGLYHISGHEAADRYVFATEAARVFGLDASLIQPVLTKDLGQFAPRPLKGGLLVKESLRRMHGAWVDYHEGLVRMATELAG
jgi:dTDP-4-dehydrorhamnose reductase